MNELHPSLAMLMLGLFAVTTQAQDMIGVVANGDILRIDSTTGATSLLATGAPGKNGLAFARDNRLWTVVQSTPNTYHLRVINPVNGSETQPFGVANCGDLRGLAMDLNSNNLFAIRNNAVADELVHVNTTTGAITLVAATGFTGIQALDTTPNGPKAWDLNLGMLNVFYATGATSDPFPAIGGPATLQYMATNPADGKTSVGRGTLYELNRATGATTLQVAIAGNPDLRGLEFTTSRAIFIGNGCNGANGPVSMSLMNPFAAGGTMSSASLNHQPGCAGVMVLGASRDLWGTIPLPMDVDPLLGTSGCSLYVSADVTTTVIASATGVMFGSFVVPPSLAFLQFHVQHVALEPVPGGLSFSRGMSVRSSL